MCEDIDAQEDELLALASIFSPEEFIREQSSSGGEIRVSVDLPRLFSVAVRHGDSFVEYDVLFLPPVVLNFDLPLNYPSTSPPSFTLTCSWLSHTQLSSVYARLSDLWQDTRGSVVLFSWVQFLREDLLSFLHIRSPLELPICVQESPDTALLDPTTTPVTIVVPASPQESASAPEVTPASPLGAASAPETAPGLSLLDELLAYDEAQRRRAFEGQVFDCGVCFTSRPGSDCVELRGCGHVYCNPCMAEFCQVQITEGNVRRVTCPEPDCSSTPTPAQVRRLVGEELFDRYDRLLFQSSLEGMSDVVYCPRRSCDSPVLLENGSKAAVCPACRYPFCATCRKVYHGTSKCKEVRRKPGDWEKEEREGFVDIPQTEGFVDIPQTEEGLTALWEDYNSGSGERRKLLEKRYGKIVLLSTVELFLSESWITNNSKLCPQCSAKIEKESGCNKMTCSKCGQYFCWLCLTKISRVNPYDHFHDPNNPCIA
ncbi:E3 ubiquitin-protein ligase RNF14-like [Aplochiton taeniatus]